MNNITKLRAMKSCRVCYDVAMESSLALRMEEKAILLSARNDAQRDAMSALEAMDISAGDSYLSEKRVEAAKACLNCDYSSAKIYDILSKTLSHKLLA